MNNERVHMQNALYRIQESSQHPTAQQQAENAENLRARQIPNVSLSINHNFSEFPFNLTELNRSLHPHGIHPQMMSCSFLISEGR